MILKTENLSTLKINKLTQEQYDRELEASRIDDNALYLTPYEEIDLSPYATVANVEYVYETKNDAMAKLTETTTYIDEQINSTIQTVENLLENKSDVSHDHDDRYYTETEIDTKLVGKSDAGHNHDDSYDEKGSADNALIDAQSYTDEKIAAIPTPDVSGQINAHDTNEYAHNDIRTKIDKVQDSIPESLSDLAEDITHRTVTDAEKMAWNAKSDFSGDYNDLTNKPTIPSIDEFATEAYVDNATNVAMKQVKDDLLNGAGEAYDTLKELGELISDNKEVIDTLEGVVAGKADASHAHAISDVTRLQEALDGKSEIDHTHNYAGSSSVGGAATSANKVNNSFIVSLNGGTTEGSNHFTFDGSSTKAVNITPASISASAYGHKHNDDYYTEVEIDTKIKGLNDTISGKADASHKHNDVYYTKTEMDSYLNGKSNTSHKHAIADINGLQADLNAKALQTSLDSHTGNTTVHITSSERSSWNAKAAQTSLDTHTGNTTVHITSAERTNWNAAKSHADSAHAPSNAQANQNAFSTVKVGNTSVGAGSATDAFTLSAGSNVSISANASNKTITISSTDTNTVYTHPSSHPASMITGLATVATSGSYNDLSNKPSIPSAYTHPTSSGNKHIPSGGSFGQILRWSADGTAVWGNDNNTTYGAAGTSLGLVKSGGDVSISNGVITVNDDSHNHTGYMPTSNPVGTGSFSMNRKANTDVGANSFAAGNNVIASGKHSVAMGNMVEALGNYSLATGAATTAVGDSSYAGGIEATATGASSHAEGYQVESLECQFVIGHWNDTTVATSGDLKGTTGTAFVIGNGDGSSARSNAFRVTYAGKPYSRSSMTTTGADYAEFFEWIDSNPNAEDRRGYFVTLDGENIKVAETNDYILGVVSGQPAIVGNGDECWAGRYILDEFGAFIKEKFEYDVEVVEDVVDEETGKVTTITKTVTRTGIRYKENPDYDHNMRYIQREDRPEWDTVGMLGVLSVRDDGTCKVNGFCKVADGGIATASDSGYRVVKRVNENIVKIIFK